MHAGQAAASATFDGTLLVTTPSGEQLEVGATFDTGSDTDAVSVTTATKLIGVPFLKKLPFHWTNRKVFGQRRPRSTLWVPSGPMDAPNDREAPGANPDTLHCGLARRTWACAWPCMGTRHLSLIHI